jgi:hypothetical protein
MHADARHLWALTTSRQTGMAGPSTPEGHMRAHPVHRPPTASQGVVAVEAAALKMSSHERKTREERPPARAHRVAFHWGGGGVSLSSPGPIEGLSSPMRDLV